MLERNHKDVGFWPENIGSEAPDMDTEDVLSALLLQVLHVAQGTLGRPLTPGPHGRLAVEAAQDIHWRDQHHKEYNAVLCVLSRPEREEGYMGWSDCRVCGRRNGTHDYFHGPWRFPEGYGHYVVDHCVKPPREFIEYALQVARTKAAGAARG